MARGSVYLIGSSKGGTLSAIVKRALAKVDGRRPRVAASYAAMHGDSRGLSFMVTTAAKVFGVEVERFFVPGEHGASHDEDAREILEHADVVFMAGGDPVAGAHLFTSSGADAWLREAHDRGTSFIGISAGAIMLCAYWASWPDSPTHLAPFDGGSLVPCLGVVADLVVDCHAEEDDWAELRLVQGMLEEKNLKPRLLGLPHGGGVIVNPEGKLENVGLAPFVLPPSSAQQ
jgi:cyanophycinase-like exopeptidase